jgi:3',5'-cyclic AMP phosphodiesterase CpdA
VSGDLTEMGEPEEFEAFAEALALSGFSSENVTLIPGNHDRYGPPDAWTKALAGPLAPYRRNAADAASGQGVRRTDLGDVRLVALDVTRPQPFTRSAGFFEGATFDALAKLLADEAILCAPLVVVQHHPPYSRGPFMQWLDGLAGWECEASLFERVPNAQVLHGHIHRDEERSLCGRSKRILGVAALVDSGANVRLYEATRDGLVRRRDAFGAAQLRPSPNLEPPNSLKAQAAISERDRQ